MNAMLGLTVYMADMTTMYERVKAVEWMEQTDPDDAEYGPVRLPRSSFASVLTEDVAAALTEAQAMAALVDGDNYLSVEVTQRGPVVPGRRIFRFIHFKAVRGTSVKNLCVVNRNVLGTTVIQWQTP